jgi:hypothetical protein
MGVLVQNPRSGILSINYEGTLRGLCDDNFNDEDASVACRELYGNDRVVNWIQA